MTIPGPVTAGAYLAEGNGTSAAIAVPSGVAANDIIIVHIHAENTETITAPTGFTLIGRADVTGASDFYHSVFWKRATGSDSGTYTFSWSTSTWRTGFALRIPGCITSGSPIDASTHAESATTSTTTPSVSLTTTGADRLIVWLADLYDVSTWTIPTNYTRPTISGVPSSRLMDGGTRGQASAGSTGTVTGTLGTARQRTAWLLALIPAASYVAPGSAFDIDDWKLTLPTGPASDATEVTQPTLETYADANFYLDGSNQIVMTAPVQGSTTSGSGAARCEFREMESGAEANWTMASSGFRQLTVTGMFDPTNITDRKEMIIGQIHGVTGTPPWYLAAEFHVTPARIRLYKDGPGVANVVTDITATTLITYRIRVYQGRVKFWAAAGAVAALPAVPLYDWAASEFTDNTGCYLKFGAYNKSNVATGGTGSAISTITYAQLIQPADPIPSDTPEPGRFLLTY